MNCQINNPPVVNNAVARVDVFLDSGSRIAEKVESSDIVVDNHVSANILNRLD